MLEQFRRKYRTLNTAKINSSVLKQNLNLFHKLLPKQAICPVLKSNAYGHGLEAVAEILDKEDCSFFVVDSLHEAYVLKKASIKTPILILGYTFHENLKKGLPFHFTAGDIQTAHKLTELELPVHIEVDTGMARTGFPMEGIKEIFQELKEAGTNVVGLFSHFAEADAPNNEFTSEQSKRFRRAIKLAHEAGLAPKWIHAGNTAGSLKAEVPDLNMARIGIGLYGISPFKTEDPKQKLLKDLKPAMTLTSTIIAIRNIKAGETVSYSRNFTAEKDMTIGVLPFGYYEGLPRNLSNVPPFVGNICMNHAMIDLTDKEAQIGDEFEIYGKDIIAFAEKAGTIPYELVVRIDQSMRREVI